METIDISETHDAMTMKVDINHVTRKKPYKYIIKFDRWLPSYCPKLLTLSRQEFQGPYKSKFEMQQALKRV